MRLAVIKNPAVLVACAAFLAGCGGGGGGGDAAATVPIADTSGRLLPFIAANGDLRLFDPTAAIVSDTNPKTVDTGLSVPPAGVVCNDCMDQAEAFFTGTVSGSTVSDIRAARLAYLKGGAVYKVNLGKGVSNAPVRISSLTDACRIVRSETNDLSNVDDTAVVIERPGDGSCSTLDNNVATVIRLNSASSDAGLAIPLALDTGNPLHAQTNASGAVTGYVSFETSSVDPAAPILLVHRDTNLAAPGVLLSMADTSGANLERADLTHLFVTAHRVDNSLELYRIETSGSLSPLLYSFAGFNAGNPIQDGLRDATNLYFSDANLLLRIPVDSVTENAAVITTLDPSLRIENRVLDAGTGYVVFEAQDDDITVAGGVFSAAVGANNVAATSLAHNPEPSGIGPFAFIQLVAQGRAYINIAYHDTPTNSVDALKVGTNGASPVTITSAYWAGSNRPTSVDLTTSAVLPTESIFLAQRVGDDTGAGVDTVYSVSPATGATLATLGVITDASVFVSVNISGLGRYALARVEKRRDDGTLDYDTYVVDAESADSLTPLAETVAGTDLPLDSLQRLTGNLCMVCL